MSDSIKNAYNTAGPTYRERYDSIPPRSKDVDLTLGYITNPNPKVVEIGCAYGREAQYILTKTTDYTGIDISHVYVDMANREVAGGQFICADVLDFAFPKNVDAVFAFASLLHSSKEDVAVVLGRVAASLADGGVVFLSLKRRDVYETVVETDDLVSRRFYYYTKQTILDLLPASLTEVFYDEQERTESWFTMILQKQ